MDILNLIFLFLLSWKLVVCNSYGYLSAVSNRSVVANCNKTEAVLTGNHLSFGPNPVVLHPDPKDLEVGPSLSLNGSITITRPLAANGERVELLNSMLFKSADYGEIELCYILPWYLCHIKDICRLLAWEMKHSKFKICPVRVTELESGVIVPWNCKCPLPKGIYHFPPNMKKTFKSQPLRLQGHFRFDINIKENALYIGCFSGEFSFKKGEQLPSAFGFD